MSASPDPPASATASLVSPQRNAQRCIVTRNAQRCIVTSIRRSTGTCLSSTSDPFEPARTASAIRSESARME